MGRFLRFSVLGLVLVVLGLLTAYFWYSSASQPQLNGTLRLTGLKEKVEIIRDSEGIPHIYAGSKGDAYFALGVVHAQDRLWQLEMNRRIVAGRMAEVLGPSAVNTDRFLRTLGVRRNAHAILANLAPDTRAILEAYAAGINSYLKNRTGPLPPEFLLTGAPEPEPWQAVDSIGWQTMMAWDLGANWTQELLRMRLAQKLTLEQINEFLPPYPGDAPLVTQDYTKLYRELAGVTQQLAMVHKAAPASLIEGMGSNNWVVSGARSASGKPLLANDPHLVLSAPSIWYLAHVSAPGLNAIGATLPGIPGIVLGRNDHIAWGFTNTAPDVQDLYIERINPNNPTHYQTPDGWAAFQSRTETIKVKDGEDATVVVRETRHGPVISGTLPLIDNAPMNTNQYVISFAWTALRPDDLTIQAGIRLSQAKNWHEFLNATKDFAAPQQNMVYADVEGNIGFIAPGRVPIRKPENDLKGLAPAPGWDSRYDWAGFIPFEALPQTFNPASELIVTANHKIVDSDYPHFLTSEWALPYRAQRIHALLEDKTEHSLKSFEQIQGDHVSLAATELLPILKKTVVNSGRGREALELLRSWDGEMAAERPEPLIFNAWMREASRKIFADELGQDLMNDYWEQRNVHLSMVNVLNNKAGQGRWCRNVASSAAASETYGDCDALLAKALEDALKDLERRFGNDMKQWRWGAAHFAHSEHRPFSKVPTLARFFDIRIPMPGDSYTVNVGRYNLRDEAEPFASRHAAGFRALYDLADMDKSVFIHSTGQSGHPLSALYDNYAERWADVQYLPMKTKRAEIEKNQIGTLVLAPLN